ncbi:perlucin-like [Haliotis cracherodii]|uniref:perlucin-like n=1 Tax=Haliotis cracherodii TaxID=6455 RepID=UPI0039E941EC
MLFTLILISVTIYASPCVIETAYGTKWMSFTDVIVRSNIISEVSNIGNRFTCLGLCLQNEACVSVFYRQQHRRCQLHDVLFMSSQDGEQEMGTVYYSINTGGCPLTYIQYRLLNICYQIHLNGTTFQSGVADCSSRGEHFIVIDSDDKQNHMRKQINSSSDNISRKFHLDGSDEVNEGRWLFHDDRVMTYFAWGPGYPQNLSGKNFLVADPEVDFLWSDKEGSEEKRYICERDI